MEKGKASSLFVNDGSFMERFKRLQEEKEKGVKVEDSTSAPGSQKQPKPDFSNSSSKLKQPKFEPGTTPKPPPAGKLAFSLKQKSKLVAPAVKLSEDEEEDESNTSGDEPTKRQKLDRNSVSGQSIKQVYVASPPCPSDAKIKKAADNLATFVAKNGRQIEHITRQKNPGDTPFKFLFDESCADYKYYQYRLIEEEKALTGTVPGKSNAANSSQQQSNYQIPASALYEATENEHMSSNDRSSYGVAESSAPSASDPIAMMEFYMKKAAQEEKRRQPKHSKDEMPPPVFIQFGCGTLMILIMWTLRLHPRPKFYKSQIAPVLMLAVAHTMGNLLTNISLGRVAVSFTHTIKAMEPFFTVLFSALLLSERPTLWVVSSLIPIVGGVALASFTEASFNWVGFGSAMASNVTNQTRNVLSKKFMVRKEEALDNINLFSVITIISFIFLVPFAFFVEGFKLTPEYLQFAASQGVNVKELCVRSVLAGICFHSYQQVSYMILQMVSPVTHAVGNCVKRVVVIVSSVIFFQTPVSPVNSLGTGLALAGVFLYSRVKRIKPKPKAD